MEEVTFRLVSLGIRINLFVVSTDHLRSALATLGAMQRKPGGRRVGDFGGTTLLRGGDGSRPILFILASAAINFGGFSQTATLE